MKLLMLYHLKPVIVFKDSHLLQILLGNAVLWLTSRFLRPLFHLIACLSFFLSLNFIQLDVVNMKRTLDHCIFLD